MSAANADVDGGAPDRLATVLAGLRRVLVRAQPALWAVSGGLVGLAISTAVGWPVLLRLACGVVVGALALLAQGIGRLTSVGAASLVAVAASLQVVSIPWPGHQWSVTLLGWLTGILVVIGLVILRRGRKGRPSDLPASTGLVDVLAGAAALGWAVYFVRHLAESSPVVALQILGGSEDNAAWVNAVARLRQADGSVVIGGHAFDVFGPVMITFLGFVRDAVGLDPKGLSEVGLTLRTVLSAYGLLGVTVLVVAVVLAARVFRAGAARLGFLAWSVAAVVVGALVIVLSSAGFMSAAVAAVLVLLAVCGLDDHGPRVHDLRSLALWCGIALLLFGASAAWLPLVPLGGIALLAWVIAVAVSLVRRRAWGQWPWAAVGALVALTLAIAIVVQYRRVLDSVGGSLDTLLTANGATPDVSPVLLGLALALLGLGWMVDVRARHERPVSTLLWSLLWLVAYLVVVSLVDAASTAQAAQYGQRKLLFVVTSVWVAVATIHVLTTQAATRRPWDTGLAVALAVVAAGSLANGPIYQALALHWPTAGSPTKWGSTVIASAEHGTRVVCLPTAAPKPADTRVTYDAYACSRWAASLAGLDDAAALDWRFMLLGRTPVSVVAAGLADPSHTPAIVVIGPLGTLHDPGAWWAPLVSAPGVTLIPAGQG